MSRESGSDQTQRTVAELLAQYGGSAESAPRRRRRRAADEEDDVQQPETAPQTIIERVLSDSGRLMAIRDDDVAPQPGRRAAPEPPSAPPPAAAERTAYQPKPQVAPAPQQPKPQPSQQMPVPPPAPPPLVRRPPKQAPPAAPAAPPPAAAEQTRQVPQVRDQPSRSDMPRPEAARPEPSRSDLPRPEAPGRLEARLDQATSTPAAARTSIVRPPKPGQPSVSMPIPAPPREAMTEQLPRIPAKAPVDKIAALETESVLIVPPAPPKLPEPLPGNQPDAWFGDDDPNAHTDLSMAPMESTAAHPGPYVDDDDSQEYAVYRAEDDYLAETDEEDDEDEGPAGLDDAAEAEEDEPAESRSAGKEWLIMIGQLAVGVLGGAALWLAFNYLWRSVPAAALVVALAVTVGLVLLVRKIRRADDLQTTVLAVLVGLIVTVSPAAMLLVKS
ncbi:hypothetical protein [Lentzea sp. NBRC 102530]|uniref:hypothetical protein n=1 Tax=Lentzea sp. NBRC 102530 TaxID=3032201 RepID=UPI0024A5D05D|nr:hypothetical protein [Lentzea sp. NBRC 102530]GLY53883.1 hypothetical protein Lesp01_75390 [Lentzea sp. NBRC 102530]